MTDDLRTRIAAVLYEQALSRARMSWQWANLKDERIKQLWLDDADAVIAELGLEPQVHYDPDCEFYRYVTDWIDPQTSIAAVHQAHRWGVFRCDDGYARTCCRCQWRELPDGPTHAEHVADAVIRELNLRVVGETPHPIVAIVGSYVTEWTADE